jgi:uncharacterized protein
VFEGQRGYLAYEQASSSLLSQVVNVMDWHINADKVPLFAYFENSFEYKSTKNPLYSPDLYRSSNHDPVLVGLNLIGSSTTPMPLSRPSRIPIGVPL